jgi:hypothetical protein
MISRQDAKAQRTPFDAVETVVYKNEQMVDKPGE